MIKYHNNSNNILHIYTNSKNNIKCDHSGLNGITFRKLSAQASLLYMYEGGSKSFRPDIQKPRQMENAARDI
jgi:hypothetical protein